MVMLKKHRRAIQFLALFLIGLVWLPSLARSAPGSVTENGGKVVENGGKGKDEGQTEWSEDDGKGQVLVLRNGSILRGKITRQAGQWQVQMDRGEIYVPAGQVEQCCDNLQMAYRQRRVTHVDRSADTHLRLAQWCQRYGLPEEAASELAEAKAIDSRLPGIARMERQMANWGQHPVPTGPIKSASSGPEKDRLRELEAKTSFQQGQQADFQHGLASLESNPLPKPARSAFVRVIEPMLLRYCATAGCHQDGSNRDFLLNRLAIEGRRHPRLTERNLVSVLRQIGGPVASEDPLMVKAKTPHGSSPIAGFSQQSKSLSHRQLQLLENWIVLIEEMESEAGQDRGYADDTDVGQDADPNGLVTPSDSSEQCSSPLHGAKAGISDSKVPLARLQRTGGRLVKIEPRDPFDPSAFNSQATVSKDRPVQR
jgi:hypothetical protein